MQPIQYVTLVSNWKEGELVIIRPEKVEDHEQLYNVNLQAFGQSVEPELVNRLRASQWYIPELSLVAEEEGKIVGHILFTAIGVRRDDNSVAAILSLGPVAVLPDYQGKKVGSRLIQKGLERCVELGYGLVVLIGHPEYYPRFGFKPARPLGFSLPLDAPDDAFMVIELIPGEVARVCGLLEFPSEWGL